MNFLGSRGLVHNEFVPERKTVNAEFHKGVMDCLLKHMQGVHPAVFFPRDFSCCTIMRLPTNLQVFANFYPKKLQPLIPPPPPYSPDLSPPDYFLFPKFKMKLKGLHFVDVAEIQEAITDKLKKVEKKEFSAAFSETV